MQQTWNCIEMDDSKGQQSNRDCKIRHALGRMIYSCNANVHFLKPLFMCETPCATQKMLSHLGAKFLKKLQGVQEGAWFAVQMCKALRCEKGLSDRQPHKSISAADTVIILCYAPRDLIHVDQQNLVRLAWPDLFACMIYTLLNTGSFHVSPSTAGNVSSMHHACTAVVVDTWVHTR